MFALSGVMDDAHIEELNKLVKSEREKPILIDLGDIALVGREAVEFLSRLEQAGIQIINCPEYVRTWIDVEKGW